MAEIGETSGAGFSWTEFFIPTNVIRVVKEDIPTVYGAGLNFQDEKIKAAAKRTLCLLGMVIGSLVLGKIAWDLFWASISLTIKIAISAGTLLFCRDYIERSYGEKGSIAKLSEKGSALIEQQENITSALKYVKDAVV